MKEMIAMALILALLMTKKKNPARKFGQMTLNLGGQALEYLKSDPKGVVRNISRVEWMNKHHAQSKGWHLPPWVLPQTDDDRARYKGADRVQDIAILHSTEAHVLPLLVHQASALQGLDEVLAAAQEDGALVEDDGEMLVLDMGDLYMELQFVRNTKAGKFARFVVRELRTS